MKLTDTQEITINQCLFGYDGGHKLLASSVEIPIDDLTTLLHYSDLAPGVDLSKDNSGYWTAFPLENAKMYVLMKTWSAPEMTRPGCVWSQALLINSSEIARFQNLSVLRGYFHRPINKDFKNYSVPKLVSQSVDTPMADFILSNEWLLKLIRILYGENKSRALQTTEKDNVDNEIFSIWSQQWPRLRRSFSFRTSGSISETAPTQFKLNIIRRESFQGEGRPQEEIAIKNWEAVVLEDLKHHEQTDLRRFMWRYGSDLIDGQLHFKSLVELYLESKKGQFSKDRYARLIKDIHLAFPEQYQAQVLKGDLITYPRNRHSLIPPAAPWDIFELLLTEQSLKDSADTNALAGMLNVLWKERPKEMLSAINNAIVIDSEVVKPLLEKVVRVTSANKLLEQLSEYPLLEEAAYKMEPSLVLNERFLEASTEKKLSILSRLILSQDLSEGLVSMFIKDNDTRIVSYFAEHYPSTVVQSVAEHTFSDIGLSSKWLRAALDIDPSGLIRETLHRAKTASEMLKFAEQISFDTREVLKVGPVPWARALKDVSDDLSGEKKYVFYSFLLALSLYSPQQGIEEIFERVFEPIHSAIADDSLPYHATKIIRPYLANVPWWLHWDKCLRLKMSVVLAYRLGKLKRASFKSLSQDKETLKQLNAIDAELEKKMK